MTEQNSADGVVEASLCSIEQWLIRHGYSVEKNIRITGKAGIAHEIGFYANNSSEGKLIVAQRPLGATISEEDIVRLFATCLDINATGILITARPNMTKNAAKLANLYRIGIIEAITQGKQDSAVQELLIENRRPKGQQLPV